MVKRLVALKLSNKSYTQLADLAQTVFDGMTGNLQYPTPVPTLVTLSNDIMSLRTAISKWGGPGNRGSHYDLEILLTARDAVRLDLTQLANYAENTTPYNREVLSSVGWDLKKIPQPVGLIEAVRNLHQVISPKVPADQITLRWEKPLNTQGVKVPSYIVMRSDTSSPESAVYISNAVTTSFTDVAPGTGIKYYWIIPFNGINGVASTACAAKAMNG